MLSQLRPPNSLGGGDPPLLVLGVFVLFLFLTVRGLHSGLRRRRLAHRWGCKPPQAKLPLKDPILGLDFIYDSFIQPPDSTGEEGYVESAYRLFRTLGKTYVSQRWTSETIYTADAANIKHMLATGSEGFELPAVRVSALSSILGRGIFSLTGSAWVHSRRMLRPRLMRTAFENEEFLEVLERHTQSLLHHVGPADGRTVCLQPLFFWLTMDIATKFLFGKSTESLNSSSHSRGGSEVSVREKQFIDDYMICSKEAVKRMQAGPLQWAVRLAARWGSCGEARRRVFAYVDSFIDEALNSSASTAADLGPGKGQEEQTILEELSRTLSSRAELRDQVLHILLASRDTTASVLSNLFFCLGKQPGVFAKIREEVLVVVGRGTKPTCKQLRQLKYLRWCIQESLRLHPVIPTNARQATHDGHLPRGGGEDGQSPLFVAKDTVVLYNVHTMHRDSQHFGADPEQFRPERWDGLRTGWGYLPFNGGPRICIGQQLAMTELWYIVARMVQAFGRIEGRDERGWMEEFALTLTCKNEVAVAFFADTE